MSQIFSSYAFDAFLKLLAAAIIGGIVGFERTESHQPAGFRTHILVCVGAASVMIAGSYVANVLHTATDITRMGAQVISGIGFLGAGAIITTGGDKIRGITTAAGLWVTACMGILAGLGAYWEAFTTVTIVMVAIIALKPVAKRIENKQRNVIVALELRERLDLPEIYAAMESSGLKASSIIKIDSSIEQEKISISFQAFAMSDFNFNKLLESLGQIETVIHIQCDFKGLIAPTLS